MLRETTDRQGLARQSIILVLTIALLIGCATGQSETSAVPASIPTATIRVVQTQEPAPTPQPTVDLALGATWTRPADDMEMVYVPAGRFLMGSSTAQIDLAMSLCDQYPDDYGKCERSRFEVERPQHPVVLDGFWIDRTEVSNAQYRRCVEAGACSRSRLAGDSTYDQDDYPVAGIPWQDAADYCTWAGGRLPTEAEWEYAARGPSGTLFPWGEAFDCAGGNLWDDGTGCDDGYARPAPVGSFPAGISWCGALDMAGNVWEWVGGYFGRYRLEEELNPSGALSGDSRILRGGSWGYNPAFVRTAYRYPVPASADYLAVGFRCVVELQTHAPVTQTVPAVTSLPTPVPLVVVTELESHLGPVYSLAWSPDGRVLASAGYGQVQLWAAATYQEIRTLTGPQGFIWDLAWSPDGRMLAATGQDWTMRVWDAQSYEEWPAIESEWAQSLAWSPDGTQLALGVQPAGVQVWDVEGGTFLVELEDASGEMSVPTLSVAWSPDGRTLAVGQWDGILVLWDTATWTPTHRIPCSDLKYLTREITGRNVKGLAWSPDGRLLAAALQDDVVQLWDPETAELVRTLRGHTGWVRGVDWASDGCHLASAGEDGTMRVWDVETGRQVAMVQGSFAPTSLWSVDWSPDGSRLAAGSGREGDRDHSGTIVVMEAPAAAVTTVRLWDE